MNNEHIPILKKAGIALVVIGVIDIAAMIYCVMNRISYSSSFNIFAVIAGIFLLRGNLMAASIVRWISVLSIAAFGSLIIAWPFIQPLGLTFAQIRLYPKESALSYLLIAFVIVLFSWLVRELGREEVQAARAASGKKKRDMRIPAGLGIGGVVVMGIFLVNLLNGESANKAKSMVEKHVGPGFNFYVNSLNIIHSSQGKYVSGIVSAWSDKEIQMIPVQWKE